MIYIGLMNPIITRAVLNFNKKHNEYLGLIISTSQFSHCGGYYPSKYDFNYTLKLIKDIDSHIRIGRDHYDSLDNDLHCSDIGIVDYIHIDPIYDSNGKKNDIIGYTSDVIYMMNELVKFDKKIKFEIGTEQRLLKFSIQDFDYFLSNIQQVYGEDKLEYIVVQSNEDLSYNNLLTQQAPEITYDDSARYHQMITIAKEYYPNVKLKQHNQDFVPANDIRNKLNLNFGGSNLDAINLGPQIAQMFNEIVYEELNPTRRIEVVRRILKNEAFKKWCTYNNIMDTTPEKMFTLFAHYIYKELDYSIDHNSIFEKFYPEFEKFILERLPGG